MRLASAPALLRRHAGTHAGTHARSHARRHARRHARSHARTHRARQTGAGAHTFTRSDAVSHAHIYTSICTRLHAHLPTCSHAPIYTRPRMRPGHPPPGRSAPGARPLRPLPAAGLPPAGSHASSATSALSYLNAPRALRFSEVDLTARVDCGEQTRGRACLASGLGALGRACRDRTPGRLALWRCHLQAGSRRLLLPRAGACDLQGRLSCVDVDVTELCGLGWKPGERLPGAGP